MTWSEITTVDQLVGLLGTPGLAATNKERQALHALDRQWLAQTPFCLIATAAADGSCDVSPKGDPPGQLVHVLDATTIALAERPGNRRADGYRNLLSNPHVGLIFFIPGRGDTLRINGRARLVSEAPFFDDLVVKGRRPVLAVVVEIEQIFHHCQKAFLRSKLWRPESWPDPDAADGVPARPVIAQTLERPDESLEALQTYYGPAYAENLY